MSSLAAISKRVRDADMLQLLALFLATLFFVLAIRWPSGAESNETWFALAPARVALLSLLGVGFGAAEARKPAARRSATAGGLLVFVAVSAPFDAASYAASYPAAPLWWSTVLPFVEVLAYFTLGVGLGRLAAWLRVDAVLALLVPAVLVGLGWLDVRLGLAVFNPLTVAVHVSWPHAAVMAALAVGGGLAHGLPAARAGRRGEGVA